MCLYSQTIPSPHPSPHPCPQEISIYNRQYNQPWEGERQLKLAEAFSLAATYMNRLTSSPLLSGSWVKLPAGSQIFLWASFPLLSLHQYCNWVNACIVGWAWTSCISWSFGNVYCRVATELLAWSLGLSSQHCKSSIRITVFTMEWLVNVYIKSLLVTITHNKDCLSTRFLINSQIQNSWKWIQIYSAMNAHVETHT